MLKLCQNDTVVNTLRSVFHANIVSIPELRVRPLVVIASSSSTTSFRGAILPMLKKPTSYSPPLVMKSTMPSLSGSKTREVDIDLGLEILGNFLKGFGIPSAGVSTAFKGATKVSFSFNKVVRNFVDINELGEHLIGSEVNSGNPGAEIFFRTDGSYRCYIVDSAITSSDFSISVEKSKDDSFKINVPTISQIVSKANVGVSVRTTSDLSISFEGQKQLGFAFSCVLANMDSGTGRVVSLDPGGEIPQLESVAEEIFVRTPSHVLLTRQATMLATDFSQFQEE
jgi:hypothetical protein